MYNFRSMLGICMSKLFLFCQYIYTTTTMFLHCLIFLCLVFLQIYLKQFTIRDKCTNQRPLADLGHKIIPPISTNHILLSDAILVFMFLILFIYVKSPTVLCEFFRKGALLLVLRSISILLTDLPQINTDLCFVKADEQKDTNCTNDYMFSGHTSVTLLLSLFVMRTMPCLRIPLIGVNLFQVFLIIATRMHYSIDVFMAIALTICIYNIRI